MNAVLAILSGKPLAIWAANAVGVKSTGLGTLWYISGALANSGLTE
jgi:hypothetical protein